MPEPAPTPPPYTRSTIAAACVDTTSGTRINPPAGAPDAAWASTSASFPFPFKYFGARVGSYTVSSNGFAQLYAGATGAGSTNRSNATIPARGEPNGVLAPYWDHLIPASSYSVVRTLTTGTPGSRAFVIEWYSVRPAGANHEGETMTFQLHLFEAGNVVEIHYCAISADAPPTNAAARLPIDGAGATIGIESFTGTSGALRSFNASGAAATGTGYRFTPIP